MDTLRKAFNRIPGIAVLCVASLSGCATSAGGALRSDDAAVVRVAGARDIQERRRCAGSATERCYALHTDQAALLECLGDSIGACEAGPGTLWAARATAK